MVDADFFANHLFLHKCLIYRSLHEYGIIIAHIKELISVPHYMT